MKPILLMIDLQNDFLRACSLDPSAGGIVERAAFLLNECRSLSVPVAHVWTTVRLGDDLRMPHWKRLGKRLCIEGTEGHAPPSALQPSASEHVVHKTFFSAFSGGALDQPLDASGADTLLIAGVHLHGCVRQTILDAYERGLDVHVADDAVASDDPVHAAISRRYLASRAARFVPTDQLVTMLRRQNGKVRLESPFHPSLPSAIAEWNTARHPRLRMLPHQSPRQPEVRLWFVPVCEAEQVAAATAAARRAWPGWARSEQSLRANLLDRLADRLEGESRPLAKQLAEEIGKPVVYGRGEVTRAAALLRSVAQRARVEEPGHDAPPGSMFRHRSVGVMALVTPWNNPLLIPLGKIAPALLYGNTVVWKPAPAGSSVAVKLMEHLCAVGCPPGIVNLVCGDRSTAEALMSDTQIDAVSLTGSSLAGYSAQEICARRRIPLQAELGGNNAAIVWSDCDLREAARQVAEGAFGVAGQRCTANRRVIVEQSCYDEFLRLLTQAVADLAWGDPLSAEIRVGPLISASRRREVAALIGRAATIAEAIIVPHQASAHCHDLLRVESYYPPTIVCCDDAQHEVIQEESFAPVLAVQRALDWNHAVELCNGVRQGLVAALFSQSDNLQQRFLRQAHSGVLKINRATADVEVDLPFGGWKASGVGPPEHGDSDREFYTRTQTIYR